MSLPRVHNRGDYEFGIRTERDRCRLRVLITLASIYPNRQAGPSMITTLLDHDLMQDVIEECHRMGLLAPSIEFRWGDGVGSGKFLQQASHKGLAYVGREANHIRFLTQYLGCVG